MPLSALRCVQSGKSKSCPLVLIPIRSNPVRAEFARSGRRRRTSASRDRFALSLDDDAALRTDLAIGSPLAATAIDSVGDRCPGRSAATIHRRPRRARSRRSRPSAAANGVLGQDQLEERFGRIRAGQADMRYGCSARQPWMRSCWRSTPPFSLRERDCCGVTFGLALLCFVLAILSKEVALGFSPFPRALTSGRVEDVSAGGAAAWPAGWRGRRFRPWLIWWCGWGCSKAGWPCRRRRAELPGFAAGGTGAIATYLRLLLLAFRLLVFPARAAFLFALRPGGPGPVLVLAALAATGIWAIRC